ncbi:class I SAM-dependent methyltransferase [Rhizobium sp. YIM 134829]|uniref:class I SAM-dependent methyltransferase n=1 Tax=Rhizobium sp. YIM 134829 TaxID=3390453 RepID=UPI00397816BD
MTETRIDSREHQRLMDAMYRHQRHIYDLTRKYYLFGRDRLIAELDVPAGGRVLEVGCGTGRNLALIGRRYPEARLFGLDISAEMLASAERSLARRRGLSCNDQPVLRLADATDFAPAHFGEDGFERIVISYALSMIPEWEKAIDAALDALVPGGVLAIADFGQSESLPPLCRKLIFAWLARFHVTPRASLMETVRRKAALRGMWTETRAIGGGYAWLVTCRRP